MINYVEHHYSKPRGITPAQLEIVGYFAQGLTVKEIMVKRGITCNTVRSIERDARYRIGAKTIAQAVYILCKEGKI